MIKAVIFDIWDTLATSTSILSALREEFPEIVDEDFLKKYEHAIMLRRYDIAEMAEALLEAFDIPLTEKNIRIVKDIYTQGVNSAHIIDGMQKLLGRLHEKYRLAVLSNNTTPSSNVLVTLGIAPYFETIVHSCQIGFLKPDVRAYDAVLDELALSPHECAFIDDNVYNIQAAEEYGLLAIRFLDAQTLEKELEKQGLL